MGRKQARAWKHVCFCIASLIFLSLFSCAAINDARKREEAQEYLLRGQKLLAQRNYDGALDEYQKVLSLSPHKPLEDEAFFNIGLVYAHFGNPKRDYKKSLDLFLKILNDYPKSHLVEQAKILVGVILENQEAIKKIEKLKETIREMEKTKQMVKYPVRAKQPQAKSEEPGEGREYIIRSQKFLAHGNYEGAVGENQKILSLSDPRSPKDEALFNLGLIYSHFGNPQRDLEKSLEYFKKLIKNYPKSFLAEQAKIWVGILQENEELNQVIQRLKQVDIEIEEMRRKKTQ
ncbi:MAG: tetratricopeptide repeat protein [Thermodesulfobacteriota bacterium]